MTALALPGKALAAAVEDLVLPLLAVLVCKFQTKTLAIPQENRTNLPAFLMVAHGTISKHISLIFTAFHLFLASARPYNLSCSIR